MRFLKIGANNFLFYCLMQLDSTWCAHGGGSHVNWNSRLWSLVGKTGFGVELQVAALWKIVWQAGLHQKKHSQWSSMHSKENKCRQGTWEPWSSGKSVNKKIAVLQENFIKKLIAKSWIYKSPKSENLNRVVLQSVHIRSTKNLACCARISVDGSPATTENFADSWYSLCGITKWIVNASVNMAKKKSYLKRKAVSQRRKYCSGCKHKFAPNTVPKAGVLLQQLSQLKPMYLLQHRKFRQAYPNNWTVEYKWRNSWDIGEQQWVTFTWRNNYRRIPPAAPPAALLTEDIL